MLAGKLIPVYHIHCCQNFSSWPLSYSPSHTIYDNLVLVVWLRLVNVAIMLLVDAAGMPSEYI